MYNRYIPGPDGRYQKEHIPDPPPAPPPGPKPPGPPPPPARMPAGGKNIGAFFENLLPGGLDTEDLIVVLLLLLMSENCTESTNMPLITMLIYLFL